MKTFQPKGAQIIRRWNLVDAKNEVLGRLSTKIAGLLIGKHKVDYAPHLDSGDYVVVLNAEKIKVTGKKSDQKIYYSHSGYPGGFKEVPYARMHKEHPERIITHAVSGMLPGNRLKKNRMKRLKVVIGDKNPYESNFLKK